MKMLRLLSLLAFATAFVGLAAGNADEKTAVPATGDVAKAEKLIKDIFKVEYAKTKPSDRFDLAAKLLEQAADTKDDKAACYVLLREAREVAARAGEATLAMQAAEEMIVAFEVNAAEVRIATANLIASNVTAASAQTAAELLLAAS